MGFRNTVAALVILISTCLAWYPDYSVMVTDYVLTDDFLAPHQVYSIGLQAIGREFQGIYNHPLDNVFQNPAWLVRQANNYLQIDFSNEVEENDPYSSGYMYDYYPYYWSPYRQVAAPNEVEPLGRIGYLGKPLSGLPVRLGASAEYYFKREPFYQPYWYYYGWRNMLATGEYCADEMVDPYDDYQLVEDGENIQDEYGYRTALILALPIGSMFDIGVRYGLLDKTIDGNYRDMDYKDDSDWADEYLSFNDDNKQRDQKFTQQELTVGVLLKPGSKVQFGLTGGHIIGNIDRNVVETDTSRHYSRYFNYADTTKYNRYYSGSRYSSDKNWTYDGTTNYGGLQAYIQTGSNVNLRLSGYYESRQADISERETMWRRSVYDSRYWNSTDNRFYDYESNSSAQLDRTGTGSYNYEKISLGFGGDWNLSPKIRFIGGFKYHQEKDDRDVTEPFAGYKYSYYYNDYREYSSEYIQSDGKEFRWWRQAEYRTFAVPAAILIQAGTILEFNVGLTKVVKISDIEEGYDLVVWWDENIRKIDGTEIEYTDSSYVDGHIFPGTHDFIDQYQMNAGISLKYNEWFKLTMAFREVLDEPRYFKLGVEILW